MPINNKLYKDIDGDVFFIPSKDYELIIKCGNTHKFDTILETPVGSSIDTIISIMYTLVCSVCKMSAYNFNDYKLIMCEYQPINLSCQENIIKEIIE